MSKLPGWTPITVSSAPTEQIDRFLTYGYDSKKQLVVIDGYLMCVTSFGKKTRYVAAFMDSKDKVSR